jgi:hypothetical protein
MSFNYLVYALLLLVGLHGQSAVTSDLVRFGGLGLEYASCADVKFSIKNISSELIYIEVYAEKHQSESWTDEDYAYDLTREVSKRYEKLVLKNPATLKPNDSQQVVYNRCEKPNFVKQSAKQYEDAIIQKDSKSAPSEQRFRVQIYRVKRGEVKFIKNVRTQPFRRVSEGR